MITQRSSNHAPRHLVVRAYAQRRARAAITLRPLAATVVATVIAGLVANAAARGNTDQIRDKVHRFQLRIPRAGWVTLPVDAKHTEPLRAMRSANGRQLLAISRVNFRNPMAWRRDRRFFRVVEQGLRGAADDYKRLHYRQRRVNRVPALDIVFEQSRAGAREVVAMRFLFFRRYTLTLAVTQAKREYRTKRRGTLALLRSFTPYLKR